MYCKLIKDTAKALPFLQEGRLVGFPTGTSYGLAADSLQGFALQRLRDLKGRADKKSFTVFLRSGLWPEYLDLAKAEISALKKLQRLPLTVLVKPRPDLSHLAQSSRVGLRLIDHPLMSALADLVDVPLTATSANPSGQSPAQSPEQITAYFPGRLDETTYDLSLAAILDAGPLPASLPSTIIRLTGPQAFKIIRPGKISVSQITSLLKSS